MIGEGLILALLIVESTAKISSIRFRFAGIRIFNFEAPRIAQIMLEIFRNHEKRTPLIASILSCVIRPALCAGEPCCILPIRRQFSFSHFRISKPHPKVASLLDIVHIRNDFFCEPRNGKMCGGFNLIFRSCLLASSWKRKSE